MNCKGKIMFLLVLFSLAVSVILINNDTLAAQYKGDGAKPNGTGGWAEPPGATGPGDPNYNWFCGAMCHAYYSSQFRKDVVCLECHGSGINTDPMCLSRPVCTHNPGTNSYSCQQRPVSAAYCDKSSYLKTGHKNILRKVAAGSPWTDAAGSIYGSSDPYGPGSVFDWNSGSVAVAGAQPSKSIFYVFGGWMSPDTLNTIYDGGFTGELSSGGSYECGRCHTTGYRFDGTGPSPVQTNAQFSRVPASGVSTTSSWYADGIQCERCHRDAANDAGGHVCYDPNGNHVAAYDGNWYACCWNGLINGGGNTMKVALPRYEDATALCIECHRKETVDTGRNIVLATALRVSSEGPAYTPFFDASEGQAFLNSPHARFSGVLSQKVQNSPDLTVSMTGAYSSQFRNSTPGADYGKNSGCTGCHDVHQSTVKAVNAAAPFKKQCPDCHSEGLSLSAMRHPSGQGTPLGSMTDVAGACKICHMPNKYHLFRINTDAGYSTFPTQAQFNAGQTTANKASDGAYADAVWIDLDLACGQCHGGSLGSGATRNAAPYLMKGQLSTAAANMHAAGACSANFFWSPDAHTSNKVNFDASSSVCQGCTYSWDFGDSGTAVGVNVSHTYGAGVTAPTVTLTISSSICSASASQTVLPASVNQPPAASRTALVISDMSVSFTDSSTDDNVLPANAVTVYWGDGVTESKNAGSSFSHTYAAPGTYVLKQYVTDAGGIISRWRDASGNDAKVTVPSSTTKYIIGGTITDTGGLAVSGATVVLKKGTVTLKSTTTASNGTYSFTNLDSGTYTVTATLFGYDWQTAAGAQSLSLPVTVNISNLDATLDFHPAKSPATL